jgi:hypothetical protein
MLQKLGKKKVLISSLVFMSIMFVVVMFFVNPLIDGGSGSGVLDLQLSFKKNVGIDIINGWGTSGVDHFNLWIFTDYIYAFSYSLFFASLISYLALKKGKGTFLTRNLFVPLAFFSGTLDFIENTMELYFINNPYAFSNTLFFLHSVVALFKWTAVTIVVAYIFVLLTKKNEAHVQSH